MLCLFSKSSPKVQKSFPHPILLPIFWPRLNVLQARIFKVRLHLLSLRGKLAATARNCEGGGEKTLLLLNSRPSSPLSTWGSDRTGRGRGETSLNASRSRAAKGRLSRSPVLFPPKEEGEHRRKIESRFFEAAFLEHQSDYLT